MTDAELEAAAAVKTEGNAAYAAGSLATAAEQYRRCLSLLDAACQSASPNQEQVLSVGALVRYDARGYYGVVMSVFSMFDEYFLKDLGSDKPIWVGEPGGDLRRFARKELVAVTRSLLDLRLAVLQNLAAVCLKQEELKEVVQWADEALAISGRAPKALLRKGAALLRLGLPGQASDCLATALEVQPGDLEVQKLLREAEAKRSPTWVCVTGCCGPWGIVCGGPIVSSTTYVVPAAAKKSADEQSGGTTTVCGDTLSDCSSCADKDEVADTVPEVVAPTTQPLCENVAADTSSTGTADDAACRQMKEEVATKAAAAAPGRAPGPAEKGRCATAAPWLLAASLPVLVATALASAYGLQGPYSAVA